MLDGMQRERYPIKRSRFSSHGQLLRLLGTGHRRRLIDVGCAQGELSRGLLDQGWDVLGVEPDHDDAARARAKGVRVICETFGDCLDELPRVADVVLFADVLEHLAQPEEALVSTKRLLKPGGAVVASIPNIAHIAVRLQLLSGSFSYTDRGPLDRTHLRFFTKKTVRQLFSSAGYEVQSIQVTPAPIEIAARAIGIQRIPRIIDVANWGSSVVWPGGLAYQFLIKAQPL